MFVIKAHKKFVYRTYEYKTKSFIKAKLRFILMQLSGDYYNIELGYNKVFNKNTWCSF